MIHEKGITPDIVVPMTVEQGSDLFMKWTAGGVESLDEKDRERVLAARDVQLDRSIDLLRGIALYTKKTPANNKLVRKSTEKVAGR